MISPFWLVLNSISLFMICHFLISLVQAIIEVRKYDKLQEIAEKEKEEEAKDLEKFYKELNKTPWEPGFPKRRNKE